MTSADAGPAPQPGAQPSNRTIYVVARLHRFMLMLGIIQAAIGLAYLILFVIAFTPSPWVSRLGFQGLIGLSLALCLCSAAATLRVGRLMNAEYTLLYSFAGGVPFIGTALVFTLDAEIREYLKANGLNVGLLGVSPEDAEKLVS
jgi:hypothetical protein